MTDASDHWRSVEEDPAAEPKPMRTLATILTMPFTRNECGSYAWPTAYDESPTDEAWQALVDAGLYTQEQIDSMKPPPAATSAIAPRSPPTATGSSSSPATEPS